MAATWSRGASRRAPARSARCGGSFLGMPRRRVQTPCHAVDGCVDALGASRSRPAQRSPSDAKSGAAGDADPGCRWHRSSRRARVVRRAAIQVGGSSRGGDTLRGQRLFRCRLRCGWREIAQLLEAIQSERAPARLGSDGEQASRPARAAAGVPVSTGQPTHARPRSCTRRSLAPKSRAAQ